MALTPRRRILVTDDDASILLLVTTILRRANYDVDTATNGRDALEKSKVADYDVIVLDLMMPALSGFEFLRQLKSRDIKPKFVVVMSAASQSVLSGAEGPNVFATVRKPFDIGTILDTVRACIAAPNMGVWPAAPDDLPAATLRD